MAKDARGHGSNARGASGSAASDHMRKAVGLAKTLGADHPAVAQAMRDAINAARPAGGFYRIGGQDQAAASKLAEGGAPGKNTPAPVHPAYSSPSDEDLAAFHDFEHGYQVAPGGGRSEPTGDDVTDFERPTTRK